MGLLGPTPVEPPLTAKNLPDQTGKIFIVTGATNGIGAHLASILYAKNAKVYIAARSHGKATQTIQQIKEQSPESSGQLDFLCVDFADLSTVKASTTEFLAKEQKLHVLWNNAGVMFPPQGSVTKQDIELQLGTNTVGPFLFTKLLTPTLVNTAKTAPLGSVRVVWVSSSAAKNFSPKGGIELGNLDYKIDKSAYIKYGVSKAGNIFHAAEFARRFQGTRVLSISADPGFLKTDLYKHLPGLGRFFFNQFILKDPVYGAYTELFAGLSPQLTTKDNGAFVEPWGVVAKMREDLELATKSEGQGGTGISSQFWDWSEQQVAPYA